MVCDLHLTVHKRKKRKKAEQCQATCGGSVPSFSLPCLPAHLQIFASVSSWGWHGYFDVKSRVPGFWSLPNFNSPQILKIGKPILGSSSCLPYLFHMFSICVPYFFHVIIIFSYVFHIFPLKTATSLIHFLDPGPRGSVDSFKSWPTKRVDHPWGQSMMTSYE